MSARSSLTLVTPVDSSPSGSSVHGILQARMLEWVAILSSSTSSQPRDRTYMSDVSSIDRPLVLLRKPFIRASLIAQVVKNLSAMQETLVWFQGWEEYSWASLVAQLIKNPSAMQETWLQSLGWEDPLKKGKATQVFWPGEFQVLYSPWGRKELDTAKQPSLSLSFLHPGLLKTVITVLTTCHSMQMKCITCH